MSADFRLENCIVRPRRRVIERGARSIHVKPKAMAVLECLAEAAGEPVSRADLFDRVWPGGEVADDTLTKCIAELRKAFGDSARDSRIIETIPRLGFRLVQVPRPFEEHESRRVDSPPGRPLFQRRRWWLAGLVILLGIALVFIPTRLWLTERGVTLAFKTAAILAPAQLEQQPGIAVLPFVNISDGADGDYFSDGMSFELINALARSNHVPVIARNSSFQFKGQHRDIKEIGDLLGVTHVLEGSVRRSGESIRLTAQLIDTSTGSHIWSGVYQRELGDIFQLQGDLAGEIVDQVSAALGYDVEQGPGPDTRSRFMITRPTANLEAYDLFLKGAQMVTSTTPALIEQAAGVFERAIALDENYADAWAGRGYALAILGWGGSGSTRIPASVYPEAIRSFRRALQINPQHAFAMGYLGTTLMANDFKWAEGMELLQRAVTQRPNDAPLLASYGHYSGVMGLDGAGELIDRAYRLDPFGIQPITGRAAYLVREGRLMDAASLMEASLIDNRDGYTNNLFAAQFNMRLGRLDLADERLARARLVANSPDLNLDALEALIDYKRGEGPLRFDEFWERMQTEHLAGVSQFTGWESEEQIVAVFDLAIEQRHPELRSVLFGSRPALMPEADWQRIRDITGVTAYLSSR